MESNKSDDKNLQPRLSVQRMEKVSIKCLFCNQTKEEILAFEAERQR